MGLSDCIGDIRSASGDRLSDTEALDILERLDAYRRRVQAEGQVDRVDARLRQGAQGEAERARLAAAMQRKHAALNVLRRQSLQEQVLGFVRDGMDYRRAVLSVFEGSVRNVENARYSVYAARLGYHRRYVESMLARMLTEAPSSRALLHNRQFNDDILREMVEMRTGGRPGITGNSDARKVARILAESVEVSRADLNDLGAFIGKLDGWAGPQTHNARALMQVKDPDEWVRFIRDRLDIERTFPDVEAGEINKILREVYDNIVFGRVDAADAARRGIVTGPANLARSLGRHRVLHFKDADAWIQYRDRFGRGQIIDSIIAYQTHAARMASLMQFFGPNPEVMLKSFLRELQERVQVDPNISAPMRTRLRALLTRQPDATPLHRQAQIRSLQLDDGSIRHALDEATGLTLTPDPSAITAAQINNGIRGVQRWAKLGGATVSAQFDVATAAITMRHLGKPLLQSYRDTYVEMVKGMTSREQRVFGILTGEGADGMMQGAIARLSAEDGLPGATAQADAFFFKWSGLTPWTDVMRGAGNRQMAAWMGLNAGKQWRNLPRRYREVLDQYGIREPHWDAIRSVAFVADNGRRYVTADRIADLSDDAVDRLIQRTGGQYGADPARARRRARRDLELRVRMHFADESRFAVVEADAETRRLLFSGTRPGTRSGEIWRHAMTFKGWPLAFTNRIIGRMIHGGPRGMTRGQRAADIGLHVGHLLVAGLAFGYVSMTGRDLARGVWPPRDPSDPATWLAAMLQSGGAGIYGDLLFGSRTRFGQSVLETALGPAVGTLGQLTNALVDLREGEGLSADQMMDIAIANVPAHNLFYTRAVVDWLFLDALREAAAPGSLRRREEALEERTGQARLFEPMLN